jgi:hypothetical protein
LVVTLRDTPDSQPLMFADRSLAVVHTGSHASVNERGLVLQTDAGSPRVIDLRVEPRTDPRDALDRGADLLVTRDPELIEYAGTRPALSTFPLPWSRTFLLLAQPGLELPRGVLSTDSARSSLARDAVRAEARPAEPPFWWQNPACPEATSRPGSGTASSRIVYPEGDRVARDLAERIVALAGSTTRVRSAALSNPEFAVALRSGSELAYIVAAPRNSLAPCRDSSTWPAGTSVTPLIETRARAVVRQGAPPLMVEWDGTIRVMNQEPVEKVLP